MYTELQLIIHYLLQHRIHRVTKAFDTLNQFPKPKNIYEGLQCCNLRTLKKFTVNPCPIQMQIWCARNANLGVGSCKENIPFSNYMFFEWSWTHQSFPRHNEKDGGTRDFRELHCFPLREDTAINLKLIEWRDVSSHIRI